MVESESSNQGWDWDQYYIERSVMLGVCWTGSCSGSWAWRPSFRCGSTTRPRQPWWCPSLKQCSKNSTRIARGSCELLMRSRSVSAIYILRTSYVCVRLSGARGCSELRCRKFVDCSEAENCARSFITWHCEILSSVHNTTTRCCSIPSMLFCFVPV